MTREEKNQAIEVLTDKVNNANVFYLADIAGLDAESSSKLRRSCFTNDIQIDEKPLESTNMMNRNDQLLQE